MASLDSIFKLRQAGTSPRRELLAGLTTFLTMAGILSVNPEIMELAGMDRGGVFFATCLASGLGTLVIALLANLPIALAPGMGINLFFASTVVRALGFSWQFGLLAVFLEGLIFAALTLCGLRRAIAESIPASLQQAIAVGIGLLIAFVGLQSAGLVTAGENGGLAVRQLSFLEDRNGTLFVLLFLAGTLLMGYLHRRRISGAVLLGILGVWLAGLVCQLAGLYVPQEGFPSLLPDFSWGAQRAVAEQGRGLLLACFRPEAWQRAGSDSQGFALLLSADFFTVLLSLFCVDFFSALATFIALDTILPETRLIPPEKMNRALLSDALATSVGAACGVTTMTSYLESGAGIVQGGRTGLASVTTALLLFAALVLAPVALAVPSCAVAAALVFTGFTMMQSVARIDFSSPLEGLPAFLTIIIMPFSCSISDGVMLGVVSWTALHWAAGRKEGRAPAMMTVLTLLFLLKYLL